MVEMTQRVDRLESVLERAIARWDSQLAESMARVEEMFARSDARAAESAARAAAERAEDRKANAEFREWTQQAAAELNRKWADLASKMGTVVEDIVAPNIPRIARECFGCEELVDFMIRRRKRHPAERGREREFDVIGVGERVVIWNETKLTARQDYLEAFAAAAPEFLEYFPEYRNLTLIRIFASLQIPPSAVNDLTNQRVYAMAMGGDTMELVNFHQLNPSS